jgi:hypothetical protein
LVERHSLVVFDVLPAADFLQKKHSLIELFPLGDVQISLIISVFVIFVCTALLRQENGNGL